MKRNKQTPIVLVVLFLVSTAGVVDGANIISNPGFESGTTNWNFYTNGVWYTGAASPGYGGTGNALYVYFSSIGNNMQVYQNLNNLEPYTHYRLSFAAYSSNGNDIKFKLINHTSAATYGLDKTFNLNKSWETFSTEFTTTGFTRTWPSMRTVGSISTTSRRIISCITTLFGMRAMGFG